MCARKMDRNHQTTWKSWRLVSAWVAGPRGHPGASLVSLNLAPARRHRIASLGSALSPFRSLRELDLSRNVLTSLDGIQYAPNLRTLRLYFNRLGSFAAIKPLALLRHLRDLDLRLNPVARRPHYKRCAGVKGGPSIVDLLAKRW